MNYRDRITINPKVVLGKPCIKGTRITVELIIRDLSEGMTMDEFIKEYPHITKEGINAALEYNENLSNSIFTKKEIKMKFGKYYKQLKKIRKKSPDSEEFTEKIVSIVEQLLKTDTSLNRPGMLLGRIQGGKTRAIISTIAVTFDNGYDAAIIFTKGTTALSEQTLKRLENDFRYFKDNNELRLYDINNLPKDLTKWELTKKLIIVCKKVMPNLKKVKEALEKTYVDLSKSKLLFIEDEADYAGSTFKKIDEKYKQSAIASNIDQIRRLVTKASFLEVTATPQSLYLQPDNNDGEDFEFLPKKPSFTIILPDYKEYIGGDYYFIESDNEESPASQLFVPIPEEELNILNPSGKKKGKKSKKVDRRVFKIEEAFTHKKLSTFRFALMNFIVGGCIRRLQQKKQRIEQENYSFIVHIHKDKWTHDLQMQLVNTILDELKKQAKTQSDLFIKLASDSYDEFKISIEKHNSYYGDSFRIEIPSLEEIKKEVINCFKKELILVKTIHSKPNTESKDFLNEDGQLELRTPFNIFIGGQILDRGITISNLIGFYYGRTPKKFQQDTVLQHHRMYGARNKADLAVTRLYTTVSLYNIMKKINGYDNILRDFLEKRGTKKGPIFIQSDINGKIKPCNPNKVSPFEVEYIKPFDRFLPTRFTTDSKNKIRKNIYTIDRMVKNVLQDIDDSDAPFKTDIILAKAILDIIGSTLIFDKDFIWDIQTQKTILDHLTPKDGDRKIWCIVRYNRNMARIKPKQRVLSADPDNPETDRIPAKRVAPEAPVLILLRQNGKLEKDWKGTPFW